MDRLRQKIYDFQLLLRNIPGLLTTTFVVSVVVMNFLANKELVSFPYLALDCGVFMSWISFLCMDIICRHFGPKAGVKITIFALLVNLCVCGVFALVSLSPGMWGQYYETESLLVNDALNKTIRGSWYIIVGSTVAMCCAAFVNAGVYRIIQRIVGSEGFKSFASASYISTFIGQFFDNLIFSLLVSVYFFGWSMTQVVVCALTGAVAELVFEVLLSPFGYRICKKWEQDCVGQEYLSYRKCKKDEKSKSSSVVKDQEGQ